MVGEAVCFCWKTKQLDSYRSDVRAYLNIYVYIHVRFCFILRIPGYSFITTSLSSAVASGDGCCKNQLASHGKRAKCWTGCS